MYPADPGSMMHRRYPACTVWPHVRKSFLSVSGLPGVQSRTTSSELVQYWLRMPRPVWCMSPSAAQTAHPGISFRSVSWWLRSAPLSLLQMDSSRSPPSPGSVWTQFLQCQIREMLPDPLSESSGRVFWPHCHNSVPSPTCRFFHSLSLLSFRRMLRIYVVHIPVRQTPLLR